MTKRGLSVSFQNSVCYVRNAKGAIVMQGVLCPNNVYKLTLNPREKVINTVQDNTSIITWHRRLGHLNPLYIMQLRSQQETDVMFTEDHLNQCETCTLGKLSRKPFLPNKKRSSRILELVHSDVYQMDTLSLWAKRSTSLLSWTTVPEKYLSTLFKQRTKFHKFSRLLYSLSRTNAVQK